MEEGSSDSGRESPKRNGVFTLGMRCFCGEDFRGACDISGKLLCDWCREAEFCMEFCRDCWGLDLEVPGSNGGKCDASLANSGETAFGTVAASCGKCGERG